MKVGEAIRILKKFEEELEITDLKIIPAEVLPEGSKKSHLDRKQERLFISVEDEA